MLARAYVEEALQQMFACAAIERPAERNELNAATQLRLKALINAAVKYGLLKPDRAARMNALRELGHAFARDRRANNFAAVDIAPLMEKLAVLLYGGPNYPHPTNSTLVSQALVFCLNDDIFAAFVKERASRDDSPG